MNGIINYMAEITQNFSYNANLWIMLFTAIACGILVMFLVLLIFRKVGLWYWKVDVQVNALKGIDEKLEALETEIKEKITLVDEVDISQVAEVPKLADENNATLANEQSAVDTKAEEVSCLSKSGRLYTKAELEELIKN